MSFIQYCPFIVPIKAPGKKRQKKNLLARISCYTHTACVPVASFLQQIHFLFFVGPFNPFHIASRRIDHSLHQRIHHLYQAASIQILTLSRCQLQSVGPPQHARMPSPSGSAMSTSMSAATTAPAPATGRIISRRRRVPQQRQERRAATLVVNGQHEQRAWWLLLRRI